MINRLKSTIPGKSFFFLLENAACETAAYNKHMTGNNKQRKLIQTYITLER